MREGLVSTAFEWIILLSETVRGEVSTQKHSILSLEAVGR